MSVEMYPTEGHPQYVTDEAHLLHEINKKLDHVVSFISTIENALMSVKDAPGIQGAMLRNVLPPELLNGNGQTLTR